ncbi:hypothetical protein M413DRAFT_388215 [Hebeloma cylindrosporum]|uniref:Uncharacterized protein n=1 Tax=Hebeloma cylindrosporum TaxID=76867 RepID=A0A0C2Y1N1_HEBCY|nr:hypothetical protein M413DRAFT_388215 [Hebeloma cylindrosporum h7]
MVETRTTIWHTLVLAVMITSSSSSPTELRLLTTYGPSNSIYSIKSSLAQGIVGRIWFDSL